VQALGIAITEDPENSVMKEIVKEQAAQVPRIPLIHTGRHPLIPDFQFFERTWQDESSHGFNDEHDCEQDAVSLERTPQPVESATRLAFQSIG
jgi:hypothetical protein